MANLSVPPGNNQVGIAAQGASEVAVSASEVEDAAVAALAPSKMVVVAMKGDSSSDGAKKLSELEDTDIQEEFVENGSALVFADGEWLDGPQICSIVSSSGQATLFIAGGKPDESDSFVDESPTESPLSATGAGVYYTDSLKLFEQSSIFFDGESYILVEDTEGTSFDAFEDFTIVTWIYQTDNSGYQSIITWDDDSCEGLYIYNGYLWWYEWQDDELPTSVPLGQWNLLVAARKDDILYLYLNKLLVGTQAGVGQYSYSGQAAIGVNGDRNDEYFRGNIAEFQFFRGTAIFHSINSIQVPTSPSSPEPGQFKSIVYSLDFFDDIGTSANPPSNGQPLVYNDYLKKWVPGTQPFSLGSLERITANLAPGAVEDVSLTSPQIFNILTVYSATPAWIRVYGTSAARAADTRTSPGGIPPAAGTDFYAEVVTTASPQAIRFSPVPMVSVSSGEVFIRAVNMDTVSRVLDFSFEILAYGVSMVVG